MCSLTRKQLKSFDAIASCVRRQGSSLRVVVSMHHVFFDRGAVLKLRCQFIMCWATRKQFKSYCVNASCFWQQGNSFKVVVSMLQVLVDSEAV